MKKKAIVVGATSGIGLEVARLLASGGYEVGIAGRREERLRDIMRETEGITGIYLAVYAAKLQHVGVNHSAAQDFHPSCMLAESAALTAADVA